MSDDPLSPWAWSSPWPAGETGRHSPLGTLDELVERGSRYSDKSASNAVGELRDFQRDTVNVLASLGPEYRDLAVKADKIKFPAVGGGALWPGGPAVRYRESDDPNVTSEVTLAGRPPKLSDGEQNRCYQDLARLTALLTQARKRFLGQPSLYAHRTKRRGDSLDRLVRAVLQNYPHISQEDLCKKVDELCEREKTKTPILPSWQKRGSANLLGAYENPSTRRTVAKYISIRRSALKRTSQS